MPRWNDRKHRNSVWLALGLFAAGAAAGPAFAADTKKVDYNRDIRPILSNNCYACHGPDDKQRKAKLRLDVQDSALAELKDGGHAIVPGNADESELVARIESDDPTVQMPPPKSRKQLTPDQIALLRRWVEQGAKWSRHWSFEPPKRPELPAVSDKAWSRNPIDQFILARLEDEGLKPAPEADKVKLIRRVTLTLTGLPPTPAEVDAFLADGSPGAYEKVVDRLLQSPRYGEHMARFWLDDARYGDTHGLHLDNYREIWPYRDWVIKAFNQNKPYDQFVVEQLAGDLLPGATLDQKIATGYNRCHVSTSEGGSIEEEVYVRNVLDQVETNGTVFLGLTIGCARCHDHKYDPVTQKDFYSLFAFFNNIDGPALDGNSAKWPPIVQVPSAEQKAGLAQFDQKIAALKERIAKAVGEVKYDPAADANETEFVQRSDFVWFDDALPSGAKPTEEGSLSFVANPDHPVLRGKAAVRQSDEKLGRRGFKEAKPGLRLGEGDTLFAYVWLDPIEPPKEVMLEWTAGGKAYRAYWGENQIDLGKDGSPERVPMGPLPRTAEWVRLEVDVAKLKLKPSTVVDGLAFLHQGGTVYWDQVGLHTWTPQPGQSFETLSGWIRAQRATRAAALPAELQAIVKLERAQRNDGQRKQLTDYFVQHAYAQTRSTFDPLHEQLAQLESGRKKLDDQIPTTLVFRERKEPRQAYVLDRGEYDRRKDPVGRATPAFLPPLPSDAPRDRLGLARWLVDPSNPLPARVEANRLWQQTFGVGIVKTAEDFGAQGEPPSHPELLDCLAVQFREDGWDVKRFMKRLVTSATFRQSSELTPERKAKDPDGRLLSHWPRHRLDAETLRDQALASSGLLIDTVGGPSVKPPQPSGLWEAVGYTASNTAKFVADKGCEKVHRRSMYTFWKRTSPPPQMTTLDAPSREACTARRERTNTPLQALLMMNETQFVEASRALAARSLREGGDSVDERLGYMFRLATARRPESEELSELSNAYHEFLATYTRDVEAAKKLIAQGESKPDPALNPSELAAATMVANAILNLDEVLNKE